MNSIPLVKSEYQKEKEAKKERKKIKREVIEDFLSGGAQRFEKVGLETLAMIDNLNHNHRSIREIEEEMINSDKFYNKMIETFAEHNLVPENNPDMKLSEIGLEDTMFTTFRQVCAYANSLYIELIIAQFSYYVTKLQKLGVGSLDELVEQELKKEGLE